MKDYYVARTDTGDIRRCSKAEAERNGWDHWRPFDTKDLDLSGTGLMINTPHLSIEEQKSLSLQAGRQITDKDDLKRYHAEAGTRTMEAGEHGDRMRKDMKEWVAAGGSSSGTPLPESCRPERPVANPVDIRQIYEEIRRR